MKKVYTVEYWDNRKGKGGDMNVVVNYGKNDDPYYLAKLELNKRLKVKNFSDVDVRRIY